MLESILVPVANWIKNLISEMGYAGVVIAMAIESFNIPLPSEIIMPFAGYLVFEGRFTMLGATLAGAVGNIIGSVASYCLGYYGGRPFIEKYGRYFFIRKHELELADRYFTKYGDATVFFTRMLPIIRTFISLPAGISRTNFLKFCILTFLGSIPWCWFLAWVGFKFGENLGSFKSYWHIFDAVVAAGILVLAVRFVFLRLRRSNRESSTES
jgi:membrane protein DedA with SNARE-associated domain